MSRWARCNYRATIDRIATALHSLALPRTGW